MSLLKQDSTKKGRVDEEVRQIEFNAGDEESGEYKVEAIWDCAVSTRESKSGHLPNLYYLVPWKRYSKEKNTEEPASVVQQLKKLIISFYKDHPDKPTAISPTINTTSPIATPAIIPTVKSSKPPKWKQIQSANNTNKRAKKNWAAFDFYHVFGWIWVSSTLNILNRTARDCIWLHVTARDF